MILAKCDRMIKKGGDVSDELYCEYTDRLAVSVCRGNGAGSPVFSRVLGLLSGRWGQRFIGRPGCPRPAHSEQCRATLDSAADLVFAAAIAVVVLRNVQLPAWLWVCAGGIAAVRLAGYGVGFIKYRTFSALHTYANKATGALIFAFPILYAALGLTASGVILCVAALFSSVEEFAITVSSPMLNRNCKGFYQKADFLATQKER